MTRGAWRFEGSTLKGGAEGMTNSYLDGQGTQSAIHNQGAEFKSSLSNLS